MIRAGIGRWAGGRPLVVSRQRLKGGIARVLVALALLFMTRPFESLLRVGDQDVQLALIGVIIVLFGLDAIRTPRRFFWYLTRDKLLLVILFLVVVSLGWSFAPWRTVPGLANLAAGTFFGFYLALRFRLREQVEIIVLALGIGAVLSLLLGAAFPELGRMVTAGGDIVWDGIYEHKNSLGRYMAILGVAVWALIVERPRRAWAWTLFLLSLFLILRAESATPLLAVALVVVFQPVLHLMRQRARGLRLVTLVLVLAAALAGVAVLLYPQLGGLTEAAMELLGRGPERDTLGIRLDLWGYVWENILERPTLGYGFDAFWVGANRISFVTRVGTVWEIQQAHNGFLELWLQLGAVGLGLMLIHLIWTTWRAIAVGGALLSIEYQWVLGYVAALSVLNVSYSAILGQLTIPWSLYVALSVSLGAALTRQRWARAATPPA